jgi:hypothetical protein
MMVGYFVAICSCIILRHSGFFFFFLQRHYHQKIAQLCRRHPDLFPQSLYTLDLFLFAYNSVVARAFGRRLPWSAMVPFADCLNHSNVQNKYDYNVGENGTFRMFPTDNNKYLMGSEVFNSYGRRNNITLLLDYGFALLENEWDEVGRLLMKTVSDI